MLDRTAFFPEGGGQPCDLGTLGTAKVTDVHTDGATITHTTDAPLEPGTAVTGRIDWPRRLDAMQQHTGEHILSGTLHRLFGAENVGFHIGTPYVRMDTSIPLSAAQLARAEAEANAAVRADTPVNCYIPDAATLAATEYRSKKELTGDVRLVEAGGDCCACCGTHLARTGEVGLIKIISAQHYKTGMRLAVACGQRAYDAVAAICADAEAAGRVGKLSERHGDKPPGGRELHRVTHGVHEDLVQAQGIGDHLGMGHVVHIDRQIDAAGRRLLAEHALHLDHGIRQADDVLVEGHLAALDAAHIQNVVHQAQQVIAGQHDLAQAVAHTIGVVQVVQRDGREARDGVLSLIHI